MPRLEVFKIEFEYTKENPSIGYKFYVCLKRYASNAISKVKTDCDDKNVIFEFEKPISINTVNNAIAALIKETHIKIDEIEYKPKEKKVEVEIE